MNVANLQLCKALYEVSGWGAPDGDMKEFYQLNEWYREEPQAIEGTPAIAPKYDLGYLLRKLPKQIKYVGGSPAGVWFNLKKGEWQTSFTLIKAGTDDQYKTYEFFADTPEDAACSLAIELFKQGILTK
jgi:hypothetical protein